MAAGIERKGTPRKLPGRLGTRGWIYAGKYQLERYAYLLHRITGLALILYLFLHIYVVGERAKGQAAWDRIMSIMDNPVTKIGEFLILLAFIYHAINGLRLIVIQLGFMIGKPSPPYYPYKTSVAAQRPFLHILMLIAAAFVGISVVEFFKLY